MEIAMSGKFIGYHAEHELALYVRKELTLSGTVKKAVLKLSALGVVKGFCNGAELDEDLLTPGWVNYHKRIPYYTFDITEKVQTGANALAFTLGHGWAIGTIAWFGTKNYGNQPLLWCEAEVEYADGRTEIIGSGDTFKVTFGAIRENDIYDGENQDGRRGLGDFSAAGYDDSAWENAAVFEGYTDRLEPAICPLTKKKENLPGAYLHEQGGFKVYGFDRNHAGVPEVFIKNAASGTKLTIIYGELLNDDGSVYTENLRKAKATDTYICAEGDQCFAPYMTFHGYQYLGILVEGSCEIASVNSRMIYSDIPFHSTFACSDDVVNQLFKNIICSQKSNFVNVPTDCPQRDERLGWTGDAQVFCHSAMYNADCHDFFRKFLVDMMDAQKESGWVEEVAPSVESDFDRHHGASIWGDAITIIPYAHYCFYKDASFIKEILPAAKKWMQFCLDTSENYSRGNTGYGDWVAVNEETSKDYLNTIFMANSARLIGKMCNIIGDPEADKYFALYEDIKTTVRDRYLQADGKLSSDTQTAYVMAYVFGIMTAEEVKPHLLERIRLHNNHLATGFVGVKYLLPVLCELGEYDLAYEIFTNKDYPSWCYPVINGATSIWERWNGYVVGVGLENPSMNSFNHYSFGAVCEWMYSMMLGIRHTEDGVVIRPLIDESGHITWAEGSTVHEGETIAVAWKNVEDGWTELTVQKPENVALDLAGYASVKEIAEGKYLIKRA